LVGGFIDDEKREQKPPLNIVIKMSVNKLRVKFLPTFLKHKYHPAFI